MRITFVLPVLNMSGGTRVVAIYARELTRMGHVVRIVAPPPRPMLLRQKLRGWLEGGSWIVGSERRKSHLDGTDVDCRVLDRSRPVADEDVPDGDVIIATWWETAEWVNALSPKKGAKVYFVQGHEVFSYLPVHRCHATYRLKLHKIVVSNWLKHLMESEYQDDQVDVVPNAVDKDQFFSAVRAKQNVPTVGFLYSSTPIKGVDISLAALRVIKKRIPELRLLSFGANHLSPKLPLLEGADFFLSPPQGKIRELYSACDVWLTASKSEGFNLTAMEAMACRTPVVSTRTGWPAEAIQPGYNGLLANIDDIDGLARGVEWVLLQSDKSWRKLSANAFASVAESSWQASAVLFEAALKNACTRAARGEIAGRPTELTFNTN